MSTKKDQQFNFMANAKRYGRVKNLHMCYHYVKKAKALRPLSDMQWYYLQEIIGETEVLKMRTTK